MSIYEESMVDWEYISQRLSEIGLALQGDDDTKYFLLTLSWVLHPTKNCDKGALPFLKKRRTQFH